MFLIINEKLKLLEKVSDDDEDEGMDGN